MYTPFGSLAIFCSISNFELASNLKHHLEDIWEDDNKMISIAVAKDLETTWQDAREISQNYYIPVIVIFEDESETQEDCRIIENSLNRFENPGAAPIRVINTYGMDSDFSFRQAINFIQENYEFIKDIEGGLPPEVQGFIDSLKSMGLKVNQESIVLAFDEDEMENPDDIDRYIFETMCKIRSQDEDYDFEDQIDNDGDYILPPTPFEEEEDG